MTHRQAAMDPGNAEHKKDPGRRKVVNLAEDLQFGWVIRLAASSWDPKMEFAVKDEAKSFDEEVLLVSDTGTEYYLTIDDYKGTEAVRFRSADRESYGFVTFLETVGTIGGNEDEWEQVW